MDVQEKFKKMKNAPVDPFKNLKLDKEELEIEAALSRGEYRPVKNLAANK